MTDRFIFKIYFEEVGKMKFSRTSQDTVEFWVPMIGQEIFAQNRGFIIRKAVKIMISEG